jgi:hypothetical protein
VPAPTSPAELIAERLTTYLGRNTARTAVRSFADRALGKRPEQIGREEAPRLVEALRPMLRTLLGQSAADLLVAELMQELR